MNNDSKKKKKDMEKENEALKKENEELRNKVEELQREVEELKKKLRRKGKAKDGKRITEKRDTVIRLHSQGKPIDLICEETQISKRTYERYMQYARMHGIIK